MEYCGSQPHHVHTLTACKSLLDGGAVTWRRRFAMKRVLGAAQENDCDL